MKKKKAILKRYSKSQSARKQKKLCIKNRKMKKFHYEKHCIILSKSRTDRYFVSLIKIYTKEKYFPV